MLIRLNKKKFGETYPFLVTYEEKSLDKYPLRFHMEEIKEEIEAWDKGYELAAKLGIPLIDREYYKYAARYVMQYCAMATVDKKWLVR